MRGEAEQWHGAAAGTASARKRSFLKKRTKKLLIS
jgi:hypothetical protein